MEKPKGTTRYRKSKDPFGFSIVLSVLWFTVSGCVVCPLIYGFWLSPLVLPLWYLSFDKKTTRYRKSKDRQHNGETKGDNQIRKSKDRQHNGTCRKTKDNQIP
jgi:hypothetical protein